MLLLKVQLTSTLILRNGELICGNVEKTEQVMGTKVHFDISVRMLDLLTLKTFLFEGSIRMRNSKSLAIKKQLQLKVNSS